MAFLLGGALVWPAAAQELSDGDRAAIRRMFGTAEIFMDMVRQGYRPVYRPRAFDFREILDMHGQPAQRVDVIGPDGRPVIAIYPMRQLPDGTWRIDGCFLQAPDEHQA